MTTTAPVPTQPSERQVIASVPTALLIGGQWREGRRTNRIAVEDPATGLVLTDVADADVQDGLDALDAAAAAQAQWRRTPSRERAEILRRAFDLLIARTEEFALLMTLEMGKPLAEARGEVTYGAEFLRWFSEEAPRIHGRYADNPVGGSRLLTTKSPVGPCLMITPWNFPLAMATRKVAPAVAAGCTMVVKPATATRRS
jgi:succinate-semialdehyde dehydrogenase/glutarate-semialdehyde dehydrogenase